MSVLFRSPLIQRRTGDPSSFIYLDNPDTIGGAVVIAPVDATDRVAMLGRPLVMDRVPFEDIDWTTQILDAIGDPPHESVELMDARTWTVGAWVADKYQSGRIFLAGDAVHVMPPYGGFNQNTGIQDVHNIAWKLAAVINGWADPGLLETYEVERRPVAVFNMAEAVRNFRSIVGNVDEGPRSFRPENFVHPGLDIGFRYDRGGAVAGGATTLDAGWPVGAFTPTAAVGERAPPHLWLDGEGAVSTLDLFGRELVILSRSGSGGPAKEAAQRAEIHGIPYRAVTFGLQVTLSMRSRHGRPRTTFTMMRPSSCARTATSSHGWTAATRVPWTELCWPTLDALCLCEEANHLLKGVRLVRPGPRSAASERPIKRRPAGALPPMRISAKIYWN